jgi:glycosyltransferase involved in cell wall biosynthesis
MLEFQIAEGNRAAILGRAGSALSVLQSRGKNAANLWRALRHLTPKANLLHVLYGETDLPLPFDMVGNIPLVASFHQPPSHLTRSSQRLARLRRQLARVDLVITLCNEQERFFQTLIEPQRVRTVPHGVDTSFFRPSSQPRQRSILLVGGWLRDWDVAAHVLSLVIRMDPGVHIRLINPCPDNPLLQSLPATSLRVTGRLSDEELLLEYQRCGVVFFAFRASTANNALLEASACGCRIIATAVGGVPDYVGSSARLYHPDASAETVAEMLLQELDWAQSSAINEDAVECARRHDWTVIIARMQEVYHEIVGACRR